METNLEEISMKVKQFEILNGSIVMSVTEKLKEIEANEKRLNLKEEELERKNMELGERFRRFEMDKEKLALREKQFEGRLRELEIYVVEIEGDRDRVAAQLRELELKDVQFKERMEEIESSRNKDIEGQRKELEQRIREEFEADGKKLEERMHEVDLKEKQLEGRVKGLDVLSKDLARKRQELEISKRKIEADSKKLYERAKEFDFRSKDLERKLKELESNKRKIEADWKKLDQRIREVDHRERRLDRGLSDLKREQKELESNKIKIEADRKKLEERSCEVNRKERQLDGRQHKELESNKRKFEADRKNLDEQLREVVLNTKKSDEAVKELQLKRKELDEQFKKLESDKQEFMVDREKLDDRFRKLEIKIKKFEENNQELESSKLELGGWLEQVKLKENWLDLKSKEIELKGNTYQKLCKEIVMDGKALQIFLNECWRCHEKMGDGVSVLLRLSQDPAKLVFDALEGFFPPHLRNGEVEFAGHIVQRSCVLLLEQLLKISHEVKLKPEVKNEARSLLSVWITKLKADGVHFMEILGFLLVLASYNLASDFGLDELFNYVKTVAHFKQVSELCCLLGMTDKIPGLIQELTERKQHLVAIRYVLDFNLVEKFPLDSLLKDHMETSKMEAAAIIESGNNSSVAQSRARTRMISDLRAVIRCIGNYNISSSEYSPANLRQKIASLNNKHQVEQKEAAVSGYSVQVLSKASKMVEEASPAAAASDPALDSVGASSIESDYRHQAAISTVDPLPKRRKLLDGKSISIENAASKPEEEDVVCGSGKDLRVLVHQNLDFSLMRDKAVEILRSSLDPASLVFDAMKLFLPTDSSGGGGISESLKASEIHIKWCISLLKELKGHAIERCTYEEARKFGISWQIILKGKKKCDPTEIACFLLFVDVYQLGFSMKAGAAVPLINSLDCPKQLHDFFEQIGMPEFLPDLIKSWIGTNHLVQAIRYIHALELGGRFPIVPLINEHLAYWNSIADERYKKGPNLSDCLLMKDINYRLEGVKCVEKLVRVCKLELEYPIRQLEETRNELIQLQRKVGHELKQKPSPSSQQQQNQNRRREDASSVSSSKKLQCSLASKSTRKQRLKIKRQQKKRSRAEQFSGRCQDGINSNEPHPPLPPPPHHPWVGFDPPPPPPNQFEV